MTAAQQSARAVRPSADGASPVARAGAPWAIRLEDVSFTYAGSDSKVLEHVGWTVPEGAFALLVGDTGSGKSTLLSLIKHEIAPTGARTGTIEVLGESVDELSARESAQKIGYVFQNPENQIVCESVWHEMAFGLENLGAESGEMRRLIAETSYFFGIDDWFRDDTATLSGGRKQILALAATLVMQPRVLLLDEPTAQLDPIAERNFLHALFRVNRELGCTVVVATHRPRAMIDYATCAYAIRKGRVEVIADLGSLHAIEPLLPAGASRHAAAAEEPAAPVVELSRAWFRYGRDADWVLRGLELAIAPGRIHALVGGNGCGKSTLLSLMAGIERLQRGGLRIKAPSKALLPQDPRALFVCETALDEIMEWSGLVRYAADDAIAMLERLGLAGVEARHPYDLSGGQQQLLALGKLLLTRPRLLLLDEPTKGLDLASRRMVARTLIDLRDGGASIIAATHDLDFAQQVADEVSMVFDGEVACTAPSEEFFRGNVYYRP